jgi:hypothetical protein
MRKYVIPSLCRRSPERPPTSWNIQLGSKKGNRIYLLGPFHLLSLTGQRKPYTCGCVNCLPLSPVHCGTSQIQCHFPHFWA